MNSGQSKPVRLYDFPFSGNGYKVRLALSQLHIPIEYELVDLVAGETRADDFLARNPVGQIPVLELQDGTLLRESNAILLWLCEGTWLMPGDSLQRAQVLQWMFYEQSNIDKVLGRCRFMETYPDFKQLLPPGHLDMCRYLGAEALALLDAHLAQRQFMVADSYSAADIAVYAYVHCAGEGGFEMGDYPGVTAWCNRVAGQDDYVSIDAVPGGPS